MLSRLDSDNRKMIVESSFNLIMWFNFSLSGRSLRAEAYKESLAGIKGMLSMLVNSGLLSRGEAASFIDLLTFIRRHDVLRLNLTKKNLEYAFEEIASLVKSSRPELHKLCIVMVAVDKIRSSVSSKNVFQILRMLNDLNTVKIFDDFISDMSGHVLIVDAYHI